MVFLLDQIFSITANNIFDVYKKETAFSIMNFESTAPICTSHKKQKSKAGKKFSCVVIRSEVSENGIYIPQNHGCSAL